MHLFCCLGYQEYESNADDDHQTNEYTDKNLTFLKRKFTVSETH